jgi:hypothetical protein
MLHLVTRMGGLRVAHTRQIASRVLVLRGNGATSLVLRRGWSSVRVDGVAHRHRAPDLILLALLLLKFLVQLHFYV